MISPFVFKKANSQNVLKDINIIFDGDSLTYCNYYAGIDQYWPKKVRDWLTPRCNSLVFNSFGVGGQTTTQMIADMSTQIIPLFDSNKYNIIVAWEDVNQILNNDTTAQQNYDLFTTYFTNCRNAGADLCILITSPYPRTVGGAFPSRWTTARLAQQKAFMDLAQTIGVWDITIDLRSAPNIGGVENQEYNSPYFGDWVHMGALGYDEVAIAVENILLPYLQ